MASSTPFLIPQNRIHDAGRPHPGCGDYVLPGEARSDRRRFYLYLCQLQYRKIDVFTLVQTQASSRQRISSLYI